MQVNTHPVSDEQVMAFLDDELPPAEAKAVAQHLADCWQCQVLLADLKGVSGVMKAWTVDEPRATLEAPTLPARHNWLGDWRMLPVAALIVICLGGVWLDRVQSNSRSGGPGEASVARRAVRSATMPESEPLRELQSLASADKAAAPVEAKFAPPSASAPAPPTAPMIVRTAELALTAARFDPARSDIERIAKFRGGYVADLAAASVASQPRSLKATLRIPSAQLDAAISDLRQLGHVDHEAQRGEDVTRQYVDVNARIANLREAEHRLTTILRERTGRLSDVLAVEEQIDNTRGQIEVAEAEQKNLANQVTLATVQVSIAEVYHARLDNGNGTVGVRLRNAAVNGIRLVASSIVGLLLWMLNYAPVLMLAAAVLFWPARLLWKRMRA